MVTNFCGSLISLDLPQTKLPANGETPGRETKQKTAEYGPCGGLESFEPQDLILKLRSEQARKKRWPIRRFSYRFDRLQPRGAACTCVFTGCYSSEIRRTTS